MPVTVSLPMAGPAPAPAPHARLPWRAPTRPTVGLAGLLAALAAGPLVAQQSSPPQTTGRATGDSLVDSLVARLQRAEEAIALLQQQLATQAASATQTESRARFDISGRVIVNGFFNTGRVNNTDVPQFARPDSNVAGSLLRGGIGAAIRQTTLSARAFVPRTLGGAFTGDVSLDFYGGQQASPGGRNFPLIRIRTARGVLRWRNAEVMIGQDVPLVAPVEPVSVAAVGVPEFGTAGNLWLWLPQGRLTLEQTLNEARAIRVGIAGSVVAPTNGDATGLFDTGTDQAERSRRPVFESRVHLRWGPDDAHGEVGVGVHKGWLAHANNETLVSSEALVGSALIPLGWLELRGEAFTGQALRGLGGGGIAQGVFNLAAGTAVNTVPVRSKGGWGQANVRFRSFLTLGAGCGWDTPNRADFPPIQTGNVGALRLWNNVCEGHAIARPDGPIVAGFTYRRLRTRYGAPLNVVANEHLNLTLGYQF
jgi:hypothetical protein